MAEKKDKSNIRVIIVGGSVAGLTLAHCLEQAGIDFVVLEAYGDIAPQVGASIGLLPNGIRILDQLRLWDPIDKFVEPTTRGRVWIDDGKLLLAGDLPELQQKRLGYPTAFIDRQLVLKILFEKLPDPSKVLLHKKVVRVEQTEVSATVHCKDGLQYSGDVVAGADGVHSIIRNEMWRHFESQGQSGIIATDKKAVTATYRCLFGISSPLPTLIPGDGHRVYNRDWSSLVVVGQHGRCVWFIFEKMDQIYHAPNIPRFSKVDEMAFVNTYLDHTIVGGTIFRDYWDRMISYGLVALDEAEHEHWTIDRLACLGDSIHKMTPHSGQGGNNAVESAAALANGLTELNRSCAGHAPSLKEIRRVLKIYESSRRFRANHMVHMAGHHTRLEAMATPMDRFLARYVLPRVGDSLADANCYAMVGATRLQDLPLPARSLKATMPFDPNVGLGHAERKLWRGLYALPLLGAAFLAHYYRLDVVSRLNGLLHQRLSFFGIQSEVFLPALTSSDPLQRTQLIGFLADLATTQLIWTIEGLRRGNNMTLLSLGPLFCGFLSQWAGLGLVGPLYNFFHYIQTPQERYLALDHRMVPTAEAKVIVPTICLGYIAPSMALFIRSSSVKTRQVLIGIWKLFPIWTMILRHLLKKTVKDTSRRDRIEEPTKDLPSLRQAYKFTGLVSAAAYIYMRWHTSSSPFFSFKNLLLSGGGLLSPVTSSSAAETVSDYARKLLQIDHIFTFGSGLFWEALQFWDLKRAKKLGGGGTGTHWIKILGVLGATTLVLGPGATMAVGWAWREELMARGRPIFF